jgi:8-oxo-dGTP pyrophosphatase MutT (NUDIX family)
VIITQRNLLSGLVLGTTDPSFSAGTIAAVLFRGPWAVRGILCENGARTVTRTFEAFPEQAAAFPVRRVGRGIQVCLIRRKTTGVWGIPKGIVDLGDTHEETALNEAWEEAGISGRLLGKPVGTYRYKKWGTKLTVAVYVMEVLHQESRWEEAPIRERMWTSFAQALELLSEHPVAPLLERVQAVVTGGKFRLG